MTEKLLENFLQQVKPDQAIWALCEPSSEDWVVLDSIHFEETDVMPVWSSQEKAQAHCVEEWQSYQAAKITVSQWLEFWVEDLSQDNIVIGVDWADDNDCVELGLDEFSQQLAGIETL